MLRSPKSATTCVTRAPAASLVSPQLAARSLQAHCYFQQRLSQPAQPDSELQEGTMSFRGEATLSCC
ncbi:hypothetical protein WJX77_012412 [Trebouxia sp. C0004]